jgi:glycosyltransferase involved in cell wall biosynthesis
VYAHQNAEQLAAAIWQLYQTSDLRRQLGLNGQIAVQQQYNWAIQSSHLIRLYSRFTQPTELNDVDLLAADDTLNRVPDPLVP